MLAFSTFLLLSACASTPQTEQILSTKSSRTQLSKVIQNVPFYPQQDFFCGPTTLAEVAQFYDLDESPESIAPTLFVPKLQGSLQIEMTAATRQLSLIAYSESGKISQLLELIEQDIPVIILQNLGLDWLPQWHYAVVVGYDLNTEDIILHSGQRKHYRQPLSVFERTWARANYWLLIPLPTTVASATLNPFIYTRSSYDLIKSGHVDAGLEGLKTAASRWKEQWLAYFLLGNHFIEANPEKSINWFYSGYQYASNEAAYLNNFAHVLSKARCKAYADTVIQQALKLDPDNQTYQATYRQIQNTLDNCQVILGDIKTSN